MTDHATRRADAIAKVRAEFGDDATTVMVGVANQFAQATTEDFVNCLDALARLAREHDDHDHGLRVTTCIACGKERWCGPGPCGTCGALTPCGAS